MFLSPDVVFAAVAGGGATLATLAWLLRERLPERLAEGWIACVALHVLVAMPCGLYDVAGYDKAVHLLAFVWLGSVMAGQAPAGTAFLAALGIGAGWELFEWAADGTGWVVAQRGLQDTMRDLSCDALGAAMAIIPLRARTRRESDGAGAARAP